MSERTPLLRMFVRRAPAMVLLAWTVAAAADDWPAWRGADRSGISREKNLLAEWPTDGPKLLWKAEGVGEGFSTPSLSGGILLVMGNRAGQECVFALDARSAGKAVWTASIGPVRHEGSGYPGPRSTPTIDGDRAYALGLNGDLVALELPTGRIVWRCNLADDFGGRIPTWGYSESPLVDGERVVVTPGGERATLVALEKTTGKPVWSAAVGDGAGYSSIVAAEIAGRKQYVQFTERGVIGVDAKDGAFLWRYDAPANGTANISTPLVSGDTVFAASGYGTGGGAVRISKTGDQFSAEEAFFTRDMMNQHGGMLLVDGRLYGSSDPGTLACIELATGETKWRERGLGKGSLTYLDGRLVLRTEKGKVLLVKVSPDGGEVVGRLEPTDQTDKPAWPHPVISDGRLYLRDQDFVYCYDLRGR